MNSIDIERRLAAAATDPTRVEEFLTALLEARVVVPGVVASGDDASVQSSSWASLARLTRPDGTTVQPFFTSEGRLQDTREAVPGFETRCLVMTCRELWEMTRGSNLVLNPHSTYGKEFPPAEIAQILEGATITAEVVTKQTTVLVGRPARKPLGMEKALSDLFRQHEKVELAYLGWKVVPTSGDQSFLLVIIGPPDSQIDVADELRHTLAPYSRLHPVDVTFTGSGEAHLLTDIEPFFVRQKHPRSLFRR